MCFVSITRARVIIKQTWGVNFCGLTYVVDFADLVTYSRRIIGGFAELGDSCMIYQNKLFTFWLDLSIPKLYHAICKLYDSKFSRPLPLPNCQAVQYTINCCVCVHVSCTYVSMYLLE